jgi:hypothetical protein
LRLNFKTLKFQTKRFKIANAPVYGGILKNHKRLNFKTLKFQTKRFKIANAPVYGGILKII